MISAERLETIRRLNAEKKWGHEDSAVQHVAELLAEIERLKVDALSEAYAACEALVAAGLLALAEKEEARARRAAEEAISAARDFGFDCGPYLKASRERDEFEARAACLREMALAVSLGQFRTAECNEAAIVKAHRDAAGFNPSKGGRRRASSLSPARRSEIARAAANARWEKKSKESAQQARARWAKKGE